MFRRIQVLTFALAITAVASADTLRVPSEYPTIQAAMTAAVNGDTVLVADGTYTGVDNTNLMFNLKAITVRSENGPENCIIDCQGAGSGFLFFGEPPESVVEGLTITNGGTSPGAGLYMYYNSDPTVSTCIITGNASGMEGGGGIYCALANPTITNCTITGNTGLSGGGIYLQMSSPVIRNCVIAGNAVTAFGGAVYCDTGSDPTITNSILWGNGSDELYVEVPGASSVSYSNIQGGWSGLGNIDANPLFTNAANGDYHLAPGSPAIDAGNNAALPPQVTTDLDSNPRFVDDPATTDTGTGTPPIVDMGAYELQVTCPADLNGDGTVNVLDVIDLLLCFGLPAVPGCESEDVNDDGAVNVLDLIELLLVFGQTCP